MQMLERRTFLKLVGAAAVTAAQDAVALPAHTVAIVVDPDSAITRSEPVSWAVKTLQDALSAKGIAATLSASPQEGSHSFVVVVAPAGSPLVRSFGSLPHLEAPETTALIPGKLSGSPAVLVSAIDNRGFVYGLLELADRVRFDADPFAALHLAAPVVETTPNKVRSVLRAFCSEIEDKSWYYDRGFWTSYLDTLAAARFNRFNFAFGFGYDFPRGVTGDYFHFPYPYLVEVPGYEQVRIDPPLAPGERRRNLETLQFIAAETARRGLEFQLGIWTHAYAWTDSPHSDHRILGLTPATHAQYCHDALAMILKECPQITGLTLRVHGESGIPEGSYDFWQKVFDAIAAAGRPVEIDMHAKGINQIMIDMGRKTGMPVKVGPKYSAEHMSLSYHQADIREYEIPRPDRMESGVFNVSNGARRFTRYGYADLYQQNSGYEILYRLWPGTQRHLLWGDPALAAGLGRTANFCGAAGLEICEPLTFKGREGSGHPGGRTAYTDTSLAAVAQDTDKFRYGYLLLGRMLYNPDTPQETWRRGLRRTFGAAAAPVEAALAHSSRILPLVTSVYLPSASNHAYWPEMYTNMPVVVGSEPSPYTDTDKPFCVANCSPLDPQLFSSIAGHAGDLLAGRLNPRYSPVEAAQWLEELAAASQQALDEARHSAGRRAASPALRQVEEDLLIVNGLGLFFANLFRSAMLCSIFDATGDPEAGALALSHYKKARDAWSTMAKRASGVYVSDVSYGDVPQRRGHWLDRIAAIDTDIAAMEEKVSAKRSDSRSASVAIHAVTAHFQRAAVPCAHTPATVFHPGSELSVSLGVPSASVTGVTLWYRHVNHGERWKSTPMQRRSGSYRAAVPGEYTDSPYPLQYYFELRSASSAWFYPAFDDTLSNQPYYAIFKRS
uniref:Uncharacterized protein n=2 Tax=Paracidobacterium acidisoli TaxID=2303751 RepID=A0A372INP5_9BACT